MARALSAVPPSPPFSPWCSPPRPVLRGNVHFCWDVCLKPGCTGTSRWTCRRFPLAQAPSACDVAVQGEGTAGSDGYAHVPGGSVSAAIGLMSAGRASADAQTVQQRAAPSGELEPRWPPRYQPSPGRARPRPSGHLTAVRTPVRSGGHRGLRGRGGGRHVPADRLAHHRPDGRGIRTAGQAARRPVVRAVGKLAGFGHHLHQRPRFRPAHLPGDRRPAADPDRIRARRAADGAVRPHPGPGERECRHRDRDRRRAQRGERDLSLGIDHAHLGPVQPPEHRLGGQRRHPVQPGADPVVRRGSVGHRTVRHRHRIRLLGTHLGQRPGRVRHQGRRRPADLEPGRPGGRAHAVAGGVRLAERPGQRRPGAASRPGQPGRAAAEQDRRAGRRGRPDQPAGPGRRRPAGAAVEQAQPGRPEPDDRRRRDQGHQGGHGVPGPLATVPSCPAIDAAYPDYAEFFGTDGAYSSYGLAVSGSGRRPSTG